MHTEALKRRTQILFLPDISLIINRVNLQPNSVVVEAGIGSGSLSHALMQCIAPKGHLYNFDLYQERVDEAHAEFEKYAPGLVTSKAANVLELGFPGVPSKAADFVFLDLPSPERCLEEVRRVAKPFAHFVVFLPCIE